MGMTHQPVPQTAWGHPSRLPVVGVTGGWPSPPGAEHGRVLMDTGGHVLQPLEWGGCPPPRAEAEGGLGLAAAISSGLGTVLKGPFPGLGGCSQLGGGCSSPLQRGLCQVCLGARGGIWEVAGGQSPNAFAKRFWWVSPCRVAQAVRQGALLLRHGER